MVQFKKNRILSTHAFDFSGFRPRSICVTEVKAAIHTLLYPWNNTISAFVNVILNPKSFAITENFKNKQNGGSGNWLITDWRLHSLAKLDTLNWVHNGRILLVFLGLGAWSNLLHYVIYLYFRVTRNFSSAASKLKNKNKNVKFFKHCYVFVFVFIIIRVFQSFVKIAPIQSNRPTIDN